MGKSLFKNRLLTINQQRLISWTKFYQNVQQSPDCPADKIVKDDDALDGWVIKQNKKRKAAIQEKLLEDKGFNKGGEVFIPTDSHEVAKEIYEMNSSWNRRKIKTRFQQIQEEGIVEEQHLRDVKQSLRMQRENLASQKMKGR